MGILDSLKENAVDVRRALGPDGRKFVIHLDWYVKDFIRENREYQVWISAVCGFVPDGGIVEKMYEKKLSDLYDSVMEFPGVGRCSPVYIVTMEESVGVRVRKGYELCFGITGDVRSAYGALRLVYGLCSLLWLENVHRAVPVAVQYMYNGGLNRTFVQHDFFSEFYYAYKHESTTKYYRMYGRWKVFSWKLTGREEQIGSKEEERIIEKCFNWHMRIRFKRAVSITANGVFIGSDSISNSKSITVKRSDFERYCGDFLKG